MSHATKELQYIDKEMIFRSKLDDRVKQAYIDRLTELDSRFRSVLNDDPDNLPECAELRSLSIRFYRDTGTEGELQTLWPAGWEKEGEIDLGLGDYPTTVKQTPLDMAAMNVEVDAFAAQIHSEDKRQADAEANKQDQVSQRTILPIRKRLKTTSQPAKTK